MVKIRAFTLIELIVVLAIVALLLTLAMPRYFQSIDTSKQAVLKENLHVLRSTIDKFYADKGRYPESLEELVDLKYLRAVPLDPITEQRKTWVVVAPDGDLKGRVFDVKSGALGNAVDGKPFAEW